MTMLTAAIRDILDMQRDSRYAARGTPWRRTYQHKCKKWLWEKDEDGPEEVTPAKNSALEELSEIFHNIESAKSKMLKLNQT